MRIDTSVDPTDARNRLGRKPEQKEQAEGSSGHGIAFLLGKASILSNLKSLLETGESLEATRRWPKGL